MFPRDAHEPRLVTWIRNPIVRRILILSSLWLFIATVLIAFHFVLLPFGLALLLAFVIEPFVEFATRLEVAGRSPSRAFVVISLYAVVFTFVFLFARWALPQVGRELGRIGSESGALIAKLETQFVDLLGGIEEFARANHIPVDRQEIESFVHSGMAHFALVTRENVSNLIHFGSSLLAGLIQGIFGTFLVLMLTTFLSVDRHRIERFAYSLVPPDHLPTYAAIIRGISSGLAGVVRGQMLICLTNGTLTFLGLWIFGVKFPLILATVAMTFSLIPIFGSILSTIPIVAVALTQSLTTALFALAWIIGIHLFEANLLNPKIMGGAAKIHPVLVVFVLIVGEKTNGLIGALFAVPIASVVFTLFEFLHKRALAANAEVERVRRSSAPPPPALERRPENEPRIIAPRISFPPTERERSIPPPPAEQRPLER